MNDYNTLEKIEEYFKKVDCYGKKYNYCFGCGTIQNNYFGAIGTLISIKKNKNILGYLLNKNENGICLIPMLTDTLTKNKIDLDNYIFLPNEIISEVTIKNEFPFLKKIKITLRDGTKYSLRTSRRIVNVDYHKINLDKFIETYKRRV